MKDLAFVAGWWAKVANTPGVYKHMYEEPANLVKGFFRKFHSSLYFGSFLAQANIIGGWIFLYRRVFKQTSAS